MNRDLKYCFHHSYRQKDVFENSVIPEPDERLKSVPVRPEDSFLSIVYALDPITKLPTGDLNYLVSDKVNPEVKRWVLDNLLVDVSSAANPAAPDGLSDDDIAALARDPHESVTQYMERVNLFARSNSELYARLSKQAVDARRKSVQSQDGSSAVSSE